MIVQSLDISNYYGYVSREWAARCVDAGIRHAIIRLSLETNEHINIARHQIAVFQDAGMEMVSGYWWAYPTLDDPRTIATRVVGTYPGLPLYAADLEDDQHSYPSPIRNIDWLHLALAGFAENSAPSCIYTGEWYWRQWMGNTDEFRDVPLWVANWDRTPGNLDFTPFGGWTAAAGKQWCGEAHTPDSIVAGVAVDRSTWDTDRIPGGDDLSDTERAELIDLRNYVGGLTENVLKPGFAAIESAAQGQRGKRWDTVRAQIAAMRQGSGVEA